MGACILERDSGPRDTEVAERSRSTAATRRNMAPGADGTKGRRLSPAGVSLPLSPLRCFLHGESLQCLHIFTAVRKSHESLSRETVSESQRPTQHKGALSQQQGEGATKPVCPPGASLLTTGPAVRGRRQAASSAELLGPPSQAWSSWPDSTESVSWGQAGAGQGASSPNSLPPGLPLGRVPWSPTRGHGPCRVTLLTAAAPAGFWEHATLLSR